VVTRVPTPQKLPDAMPIHPEIATNHPHLRSPTPKALHIVQPNGQLAKQAPPWVEMMEARTPKVFHKRLISRPRFNFSHRPGHVRMRLTPKRGVRKEGGTLLRGKHKMLEIAADGLGHGGPTLCGTLSEFNEFLRQTWGGARFAY
jgi:hypothetical protein